MAGDLQALVAGTELASGDTHQLIGADDSSCLTQSFCAEVNLGAQLGSKMVGRKEVSPHLWLESVQNQSWAA